MLLFAKLMQKLEKALAWLSPVNPALKLHEFRKERQQGTGIWLFDRPEMSKWLDHPNNALWIYGIPGAGKTILSTLVVDEVLTRMRNETVGTAYFYIRHDDNSTYKPSSVLGSLIAQLARQNRAALASIVDLHRQQTSQESLLHSLMTMNSTRNFTILYNISRISTS